MVKRERSFTVCSTKETIVSGTSSVIQKTSTFGISQESLLSDETGNADGCRGSRKDAEEREDDESSRSSHRGAMPFDKLVALRKAVEARIQMRKDQDATSKREPKSIDGCHGGRKDAEEREVGFSDVESSSSSLTEEITSGKSGACRKTMDARKQGLEDANCKRELQSLDSESSDWDTDDWNKTDTEDGPNSLDGTRKSKIKSKSADSLSSDLDSEYSLEDEMLEDEKATCAVGLSSIDQKAPERSRRTDASPGPVANDQGRDNCQVTPSCQRLYDDVVIALRCRNAAAATALSKSSSCSRSSSPDMDKVSYQGDKASTYSLLSDSEDDSPPTKAETDYLCGNDPTPKIDSDRRTYAPSRPKAKPSSNNSNNSSCDGGNEASQLKKIHPDPVTESAFHSRQQMVPRNVSKSDVYEENESGGNLKDGHDEDLESFVTEDHGTCEDDISSGFDDDEAYVEEYSQQPGIYEGMSSEDEDLRAHSSWQQEKCFDEEGYAEDALMDTQASRAHQSYHNEFPSTGQRHRASENFLAEGDRSQLERASAERETQISKSRRFGFTNLLDRSANHQQLEEPRTQNSPHLADCQGSYGPDKLRLGDAIFRVGSSRASGSDMDSQYGGRFSPAEEAEPAEGLILRKQVMENYATRANDR